MSVTCFEIVQKAAADETQTPYQLPLWPFITVRCQTWVVGRLIGKSQKTKQTNKKTVCVVRGSFQNCPGDSEMPVYPYWHPFWRTSPRSKTSENDLNQSSSINLNITGNGTREGCGPWRRKWGFAARGCSHQLCTLHLHTSLCCALACQISTSTSQTTMALSLILL